MVNLMFKFLNFKSKKRRGFTIAEVLLALAVIGVVAAITIPSAIKNTRKQIIETKLAVTVSILNQALRGAELKYGGMSIWDLTGYQVNDFDSDNYDISDAGASFVNKYLAPNLKTINNGSSSSTLRSLGYKTPWKSPNGQTVFNLDKKVYPIILSNGTVIVHYGAKYVETNDPTKQHVKSIFLFVDLDGPGGDNTTGRDLFAFMIPFKSGLSIGTVAEYGKMENGKFVAESDEQQIEDKCKDGTIVGSFYCAYLIKKNAWKVPKNYPWL